MEEQLGMLTGFALAIIIVAIVIYFKKKKNQQ